LENRQNPASKVRFDFRTDDDPESEYEPPKDLKPDEKLIVFTYDIAERANRKGKEK